MFWKPTIAIEADVASALVKVSDGLKGGVKCAEEWLPSLQKRDDEKEDANRFARLCLPFAHAELSLNKTITAFGLLTHFDGISFSCQDRKQGQDFLALVFGDRKIVFNEGCVPKLSCRQI